MPRAKKDIMQLCRAHTSAAVKTLIGIMNAPKAPAAARIQAANTLIDRGWGKAAQPLTGEGGGPLIVQVLRLTDADNPSSG